MMPRCQYQYSCISHKYRSVTVVFARVGSTSKISPHFCIKTFSNSSQVLIELLGKSSTIFLTPHLNIEQITTSKCSTFKFSAKHMKYFNMFMGCDIILSSESRQKFKVILRHCILMLLQVKTGISVEKKSRDNHILQRMLKKIHCRN